MQQIEMWTIEEALEIVRSTQQDAFSIGYNLSLGGGVLNKGRSDHDLDIVMCQAKAVATTDEAHFLNYVAQKYGLVETNRYPWNAWMHVVRFRDAQDRVIEFFIVDTPPR